MYAPGRPEFHIPAILPAPKKLLPMPDDRTVNGAAIHFGEPQGVLALAEGVETTLSVALRRGCRAGRASARAVLSGWRSPGR
jgi:hypothetical protein